MLICFVSLRNELNNRSAHFCMAGVALNEMKKKINYQFLTDIYVMISLVEEKVICLLMSFALVLIRHMFQSGLSSSRCLGYSA